MVMKTVGAGISKGKEIYKNYKYKYEKLSNFNITLLIKLLDKFYFTDSPFIAEEKEKYIIKINFIYSICCNCNFCNKILYTNI